MMLTGMTITLDAETSDPKGDVKAKPQDTQIFVMTLMGTRAQLMQLTIFVTKLQLSMMQLTIFVMKLTIFGMSAINNPIGTVKRHGVHPAPGAAPSRHADLRGEADEQDAEADQAAAPRDEDDDLRDESGGKEIFGRR
jgi:hypothetical protein